MVSLAPGRVSTEEKVAELVGINEFLKMHNPLRTISPN